MFSINPPEIGPRLQAYRKKLNLTLAQLASMSGVSRSMLSEIERGNANPTYGTLWHLTRALKIDLNSLISGASEERVGGSISLVSVLIIFVTYGLIARLRNPRDTFIVFASIANVGASGPNCPQDGRSLP